MSVKAISPPSTISINDDSELIAQANDYGWPGNGTAANPYVIANLTIDGSSNFGIMIRNTDLYVVIDNCTISDSNYCIDIAGSNNMTIENNTFYGNSDGFNIYLVGSNNNTIVNNIMIGNNYGIHLEDSSNNTVINNTISDAFTHNIEVELYSDNNTISNNNISGENTRNIYVGSSVYNTISNNNISGAYYGIFLDTASHNIISKNTISNNEYEAIYFSYSSNNTIFNNTISGGNYGIYFSYSGSNTVSNNTVSDAGGEDIYLDCSNDNVISNNTITGGYHGIYLSYSGNDTVSNNTVSDVDNDDIYLDYSNDNVIANNTITGGYCGIGTWYSESNTIYGNIINGTSEEAIALDNSDGNIISKNNLTDDNCDRGIHLEDSIDCFITNNTIVGAAAYDYEFISSGIELDGSDAYIDGNKLTDCVIMPDYNDAMDYQMFMRDTTITTTNTVNGQPVYLFKDLNMHGASVPTDAGELILYNVTYAHVTGLNMNYGFVLACFSSEITIDHNTMENGPVGILFFASDHCSISDNEIINPLSCGIALEASTYNTISHNIVTSSGSIAMGCILVMESANNTVSDNILNGGGFGIKGSKNALSEDHGLLGLKSSKSLGKSLSAGIIVMDSNDNYIMGNNLTEGGILLEECNANLLDRNTIEDSTTGIIVVDSNDNIASNNTIIDAHEGIVMDGSYNNTVFNNNIANCSSYGIDISGSKNNTMYANVLIGNNGATSIYDEGCVQAYDDNNNIWNSTTMGNYWSDWQTPDVELLYGIVDLPYVIDGGAGAQDNLPLVMGGADPTIIIDNPVQGSYKNTGSVMVKWTASDAINGIAKVEISTDSVIWTDVTGTTSEVLSLSDGSYTVYVRATNNADGASTASVTFTVDTVKPVLNIATPVSGSSYNSKALDVTWTATDSGSGLNNFWISIDGGVWTDVAKDLSYTLSSLADGGHIVAVKCEDKAGNWNELSASFEIDTLAPTIAEHSPIGKDVSRNASIAVAFSELMNETSVGIVVNEVSGTIAWNGNNMSFTPASPLAFETAYTVDITGKDLAGNAVEYSWSFTTMKNEGVIEGVIKDSNGNPLANATVTLSNGMVTTTDLNGYFMFENVTAGTYTLNATKVGFAPITQTVTALAGQTNILGTLSASASRESTSISNSILLIGAGIGLIIAILLCALLLTRRRKNKE